MLYDDYSCPVQHYELLDIIMRMELYFELQVYSFNVDVFRCLIDKEKIPNYS